MYAYVGSHPVNAADPMELPACETTPSGGKLREIGWRAKHRNVDSNVVWRHRGFVIDIGPLAATMKADVNAALAHKNSDVSRDNTLKMIV